MTVNIEQLRIKLTQEEELQTERGNQARLNAVNFLFENLKSGGEWLKLEGIKLLYFYRDLDIVNKRMKDFFENTENPVIKRALEEFFAGTLDVNDIIAQRKRKMEIREELRLLKISIRQEALETNSNESLGFLDLTALKVKDIAVKN